MISKKHRVKKEAFRVLFKDGKTFSTQLFSFYFMGSETPCYAFVAPKNIFKTAVKRNKFKRIGYNTLRSFKIKRGLGVFVYKKQALTAKTEEIKENIVFIFKKVGFIQ